MGGSTFTWPCQGNRDARYTDIHRRSRREFLQVGFSGLWAGIDGPHGMRSRAAAASLAVEPKPAAGSTPRAKSVILVFLDGGLSHIDSFDMKPDSPDGIRGEFRPIETAIPDPLLRTPAPAGRACR